MQPISPTSAIFAPDQQYTYTVDFWDTPMTPLVNGVASHGLQLWIRQPLAATAAWTLPAQLRSAAASACDTTFVNDSYSDAVVTDGRLANACMYWSGGAPGVHGAGYYRRVAYRLRGTLRSVTGRDWFSAATNITNFTVGMAGSGYVRIIQNDTTEIFAGQLTEKDFLTLGPTFSSTVTLNASDVLDFYYIQDEDDWGGFVFKACLGTVPGVLDPNGRRALLRDAPVIGGGLMDTGTAPTQVTLQHIEEVQIDHVLGRSSRAMLTVPLINQDVNDTIGWSWIRTNDPTGHVALGAYDVTGATFTTTHVRRQRLIRITGGYVGETKVLFTGFVDDFEPRDGRVTIMCLGMDQRLQDQFVKNYPDRISYMTYGYNKLKGTSEPVYDVTAYDNWYMEYMQRDLMVRGGLDESRTRAALTVPLANGSSVAVSM